MSRDVVYFVLRMSTCGSIFCFYWVGMEIREYLSKIWFTLMFWYQYFSCLVSPCLLIKFSENLKSPSMYIKLKFKLYLFLDLFISCLLLRVGTLLEINLLSTLLQLFIWGGCKPQHILGCQRSIWECHFSTTTIWYKGIRFRGSGFTESSFNFYDNKYYTKSNFREEICIFALHLQVTTIIKVSQAESEMKTIFTQYFIFTFNDMISINKLII